MVCGLHDLYQVWKSSLKKEDILDLCSSLFLQQIHSLYVEIPDTTTNEQEVEVRDLILCFIIQDPFADAAEEAPVEEEDPFAESAPAAAAPVVPAAPVVDEFKFTREWNMKFRERCEAKDKAAMEKKQEVLKEAREELQKWNEERQKKLAAKAEMNREEEEKLIENNKEDMNCENPWERVSKLVELNAETKHDLTRMKQVMIRMKNDAAKN